VVNSEIMLKIINAFSELNMAQYLHLCRESIQQSGWEKYRHLSSEMQVQNAKDDLILFLSEDFFRQKNAFCAVWVVDDAYVSVLRIEPYRDGVLLHALESDPRLRRNGYAYDLICAVLSYLREEKLTSVYSHIHKWNYPSMCLHEKCGFEKISDSAVLLDGTITQNYCTMMTSV